MPFSERTTLGRTGLVVGRLGISSSYRAPTAAYEEAFERGCNYFTWGTFIKGRSGQMQVAMRNIISKGKRDDLVVAIWSYAHSALLTRRTFTRGLKALGIERAELLILGYFSSPPSRRIMEGALALKEEGLVRYIGLSSHNRKVFPELVREGLVDVFHVRYNAVHRGAEEEVFPFLEESGRPGIVSFTATSWRQLITAKRMPEAEPHPTAADCYRFVLSHPKVDLCMTGPSTIEEMRENLRLLDQGPMAEEELTRMRRIGNFVYGR